MALFESMKTLNKVFSLILALSLTVCCFAGCQQGAGGSESTTAVTTVPTTVPTTTTIETTAPVIEEVDYAAMKLNKSSNTLKQEVTVRTFIDGDTVHFNVPDSVMPSGILKARFLAINTPESTGKIEEYGKKASAFTKEKLSNATSIIIESDDGNWNADSTGGRYLVWVWYKTSDSEEYRNLNIEILQNGLAIASSSANNRYGSTCMSALNYAKAMKLNVYSGQPDPDFYYGDAVELTLKELRTNTEQYEGMKVAFNGVVTLNSNNTVYVEEYDAETDMYYGMAVYYGFNLSGAGLDVLKVGNQVRIVGSLQYYEAGGTWQVSDLNYRMMKPDDPGNIQKLSEGHSGAFVETAPETFVNGQVELLVNDELVTFPYAQLALSATIGMKGLQVVDVYTTTNESSASKGAMTLICEVDGYRVSVRTTVMRDENGELITESAYLGRTIDVKGIVDYFNGTYQIKVFKPDHITIIN